MWQMLIYKSWMETRLKLLYALLLIGGSSALMFSVGAKAPRSQAVVTAQFVLLLLAGTLSGSGIKTQPAFTATKGLHGSTYYTLSLPVARLLLLATRATVGWLELTFGLGLQMCGLWALSRSGVGSIEPSGMLGHAAVMLACGTWLYFTGVFMDTFLDEQWRNQGTLVMFALLLWLSSHTPDAINIFKAMNEASPLLGHAMPWGAMAFSFGMASVMFFAAWKVIERREY
ncbi:MAG: hypothetical protein ABI824_05285 [Acidobacteriota bacterium]